MAAGWGALIQRGTQWADKGVDWAIYNKQRGQYASQVRHLRRREYQDMVHSMKEAGLNPVLAVGATPGHSAAYMGRGLTQSPGVDVAGAYSKTTTAKAAEKQADTSAKTGETTQGLQRTQREYTDLLRYRTAAETKSINQSTQTNKALEQKYLIEAVASAAEAKGREYDNVQRQQDAKIYEGLEGEILRRVRAWSGAIQGGAGAVNSGRAAAGR